MSSQPETRDNFDWQTYSDAGTEKMGVQLSVLRGDSGTLADYRKQWNILYAYLDPILAREFGRKLSSEANLADYMSAVWKRLHSGMRSFRGDAPLTAWCRTVARNALLNMERSEKRQLKLLETQRRYAIIWASVERPIDEALDAEMLKTLLLSLFEHPDDREFAALCLDNWSHDDLAARYGILPNASRVKWLRAKRKMIRRAVELKYVVAKGAA